MGRLTTHVLDTARGRPAVGLDVRLTRLSPQREDLRADATNADGRLDQPLLEGEELLVGVYELVFETGAFHRRAGFDVADPAFLEEVVLRFGVADTDAHYHVPLLLSPWSYATYRGS
ncbi:MAG: hydroxyisourate hydrolase [Pseudomonadota bacterium]